MEYIQINDDLFIAYDEEKKTSNVISKSAIQNDIDITSEQLSQIAELPSDEYLLSWAKLNYSNPDMRTREVLQTHLDELLGVMAMLGDDNLNLAKMVQVKKNVL